MAISRDGIRVGTAPEVQTTFTTTAGVATDPTSVTFIHCTPSGVETTYTTPNATITNPAVGEYVWTAPAAFDETGEHIVYFAGVGNGVTVADEVEIVVHGTKVTLP
jgi:hypothetical protein